MSWLENVYDTPEKYELEIIGSVNDPNASWSFDMVIFWKKGKRQVYAAHDAGCSCPIPFENVEFDDLERIASVAQAQRFIEGFEDEWMKYRPDDKRDLLKKVGDVLAGRV